VYGHGKVHWAIVVILSYFPAAVYTYTVLSIQLLRYYELTAFSFKWRPFAILDFLKLEILNCQSGLEGQYASPSQILCRSVELLRRYGRFSIFQDGGRPPYWICFTCIWTTHEQHLLVFVIVQNLVGIGSVVSIICQF